MLTIRDEQLRAFQESINTQRILPGLRQRFAAMGLLAAGDRSVDARVLEDVREAQSLGLFTEPELAQYTSYGLTFPGWQSRPPLHEILARPGLSGAERLSLVHRALSAL